MTFQNSVVGGVTLVRPAIQSPDYEVGTSGWTINVDGTAEFNDVTIRGGTSVSGTALYYDGPPRTGNLILSIAAQAGVDDYDNYYARGLMVGNPYGRMVVLNVVGNAGRIDFYANTPAAAWTALVSEVVYDVGKPTEQLVLEIIGPGVQTYTDQARIRVCSQSANGAEYARIDLDVAGAITTYSGKQFAIGGINSNLSALYLECMADHTGNLTRVQVGGVDRYVVNNAGVLSTYAANDFATFTPVITGSGTATFSNLNGFYQRIGKMVFVRVYFVVATAGSGTGLVTFNLPVTPYRSGTRQNIPGGARDGGVVAGPCVALTFAGGTGASVDRIINSNGADVTGSMLTASSIWTFEGWIREA